MNVIRVDVCAAANMSDAMCEGKRSLIKPPNELRLKKGVVKKIGCPLVVIGQLQ